MRIATILFLLFGLTLSGKAQTELTEQQLKDNTDLILAEGNLLYQYEKTAWISFDLAMEKEEIKKQFVGYLVYQENNSIKTIILNKSNQCIYELTYENDFSKPTTERLINRELSENESNLLTIKNKILTQIVKKKYQVGCPEGFSLNFVLLPYNKGYKFYILTGTSQHNVIPFGNDYLFLTNLKGKVLSTRKFHSKLIPTKTMMTNGGQVTLTKHSHLKTEPFISATDICTFKLYGSLYGMTEFIVYSPGLSTNFTYSLENNAIKIEKK